MCQSPDVAAKKGRSPSHSGVMVRATRWASSSSEPRVSVRRIRRLPSFIVAQSATHYSFTTVSLSIGQLRW